MYCFGESVGRLLRGGLAPVSGANRGDGMHRVALMLDGPGLIGSGACSITEMSEVRMCCFDGIPKILVFFMYRKCIWRLFNRKNEMKE